jgi:hypothetical protein
MSKKRPLKDFEEEKDDKSKQSKKKEQVIDKES